MMVGQIIHSIYRLDIQDWWCKLGFSPASGSMLRTVSITKIYKCKLGNNMNNEGDGERNESKGRKKEIIAYKRTKRLTTFWVLNYIRFHLSS